MRCAFALKIKIIIISRNDCAWLWVYRDSTLVRKKCNIVGNPRDAISKKAVLMDDKIRMRAYICIFILIRGVFEWGSSWLRGRQGWFWVCAGVRKRGGCRDQTRPPLHEMRVHAMPACALRQVNSYTALRSSTKTPECVHADWFKYMQIRRIIRWCIIWILPFFG